CRRRRLLGRLGVGRGAGRRGGWRNVRAVPARRVPGSPAVRSSWRACRRAACAHHRGPAGPAARGAPALDAGARPAARGGDRGDLHARRRGPPIAGRVGDGRRGSVHGRHARGRALPAAPAGGRPGGLARVGPRAGGVGRPRAGCLSRSAYLGERLVCVLRWAALGAPQARACGQPRQDGAGRAGRARRNRVARGGVRRAGFPTVAGPADRPARRNRWCGGDLADRATGRPCRVADQTRGGGQGLGERLPRPRRVPRSVRRAVLHGPCGVLVPGAGIARRRSAVALGIALLGSTGSIGRSALAVLERHSDRFRLVALAANRRAAELAAQVVRYRPEMAVLVDGPLPEPEARDSTTRWAVGREALLEIVTHPRVDVVINAVVGAAGLEATLTALRAGKRLALANKESLVAGGPLVLEALREGGGALVPVDSEHSAILQC